MKINEFVLDNVFTQIPATEDRAAVWYARTADETGWVLVWEDGSHFHTYKDPKDWY